MTKEYYQDGADLFADFLSDSVRSIGEMQILKSQILKDGLFQDPNEKEEVLLLVDEIIWEETHAAERFRLERKAHLLAIANLANRIQERENRPEGISGRGPGDLVDRVEERTRPGATLPLFPEIKNPDA